MMRSILIVDAIINFALGLLLLLFSPAVVSFLGVPPSSTSFYPNILGGIFIGITIALLVHAFGTRERRSGGLGLAGAISINLCGGIVLAMWLIFGHLRIPTKGFILLWAIVIVLVVVSSFEWLRSARSTGERSRRGGENG